MKPAATHRVPPYTEFHPRWYRTRVSTWWWLGQRHYLKFILREISCVFVAWTVLLTLLLLNTLLAGARAYEELLALLRHPAMVALNGISFFFLVFHSVTWFNLTPRAMTIRWRGKRLPDAAVAAPNFALWVVISAGMAWFLLRI